MIGLGGVDRLLAAVGYSVPRPILGNSVALLGGVVLTSGLGFAYWFVAALVFPQAEIGIAAAGISAMMLLATLSTLGLGTMLIAEMPRHRGREPGLIAAATLVSGTVGIGLGVIFSVVAAALSPEFRPLTESPAVVALFSAGVGLTASLAVLDVALTGLLRGDLRFARTAVFALTKLGLLFLATLTLVELQPRVTILATWVAGLLLSVAALGVYAAWTGGMGRILPLQLGALRLLRGEALKNYLLNISLAVPDWSMPILVTALLSAVTSGAFFIAWMIAGVALYVPGALSQSLYAVCARAPETLPANLRSTLRLAFASGLAIWLAILVFGPIALGVLGEGYAEATPALIILALCIFPVSIKVHYVTIGRLEGSQIATTRMTAAGAILELGFAAVGGTLGGMTGVALGLLLGLTIEAILMAPRVRRVLRTPPPAPAVARP